MEKAELEKLGAAALADIVHAELIALDELIDIQQNEIDELNKNPNRDINNFFLANERHSGYCVARDMLIRFIREKQ